MSKIPVPIFILDNNKVLTSWPSGAKLSLDAISNRTDSNSKLWWLIKSPDWKWRQLHCDAIKTKTNAGTTKMGIVIYHTSDEDRKVLKAHSCTLCKWCAIHKQCLIEPCQVYGARVLWSWGFREELVILCVTFFLLDNGTSIRGSLLLNTELFSR